MPVTHLALWAKLGDHTYPDQYHPVACHLIDVAQVCRLLWAWVLRDPFRCRMAGHLRLDPDAAGRWLAFWVGAHDIGKIGPGFQGKSSEAQKALEEMGFDFPRPPGSAAHGVVSTAVLGNLLAGRDEWPRVPQPLADRVAVAVGGHHGSFPPPGAEDLGRRELGGGRWSSARSDTLAVLAAVLDLPSTPAPAADPGTLPHAFFLLLAGLTTVADWVGSAAEFFPSAPGATDLGAYARTAEANARRAINRLGWAGWRGDGPAVSFAELFPDCKDLRPLQEQAIRESERLDGPGLVLIEAPMGEGKTEAALYLAEHWVHACGQGGLYVALPTQATSNQMFARVRDCLKRRYPEERVNLHLLHGAAVLSDAYRELRPAGVYDEDVPRPAGVVAEGWFAGRKRGLLSPFAVGTIDQALLAVLQTRHFFVRLFGLAGKTVVLDEVHAYDAYMSTLLDRLLAWLAAVGSSVVLLSATLPRRRREELLAAYAGTGAPLGEECAYPRVSVAFAGRVTATPIEATRHACVAIEWLGAAELPGRLATELADGGCAAVICNTVGRAQETYLALRGALEDAGVEVGLLHARFPFGRHDEREKRFLAQFGPEKPGTVRPRAAVLVATQVIEQSLDLDFDLLVTELAPADLVLQRTGRLHRHQRERPAGMRGARLWLLRPEAGEGGVPDFGPSAFVYARHALLRSYLALRDRATIRVPEDVEVMIEAVYGDEPVEAPDEAWQAALGESLGRWRADEARANREAEARFIQSPASPNDVLAESSLGLDEDDPEKHRALQAATRLTEPSVAVVCLYRTPGGLRFEPDAPAVVNLAARPTLAQTKDLLRAAVTLTHRGVVREFLALPVPVGWKRNGLLRYHRPAVFDEGGCLTAGKYVVRLDSELGVVITKEAEEVPQP